MVWSRCANWLRQVWTWPVSISRTAVTQNTLSGYA